MDDPRGSRPNDEPRPDGPDGTSGPDGASTVVFGRELATSAVLAALFMLAMLLQERILLLRMAENGTLPYPMWQLLCPLAAIAVACLLPMRPRIAFLGAVGLFWSLVVIGDAAYYRFFGSVTSLVSAGSAHQLLDVSDSVIDLVTGRDAIFPFAFLALIGAALLPRRMLLGDDRPSSFEARKLGFRRASGAFLLTSVAAGLTPIYEDTHHIGRDKWVLPIHHWGSRYSYTTFATTFGLYNYHVSDLYESVVHARAREKLTPEHVAVIDRVMEHKQQLNALPTPFEGIARGRRIVFVQMEAITH